MIILRINLIHWIDDEFVRQTLENEKGSLHIKKNVESLEEREKRSS